VAATVPAADALILDARSSILDSGIGPIFPHWAFEVGRLVFAFPLLNSSTYRVRRQPFYAVLRYLLFKVPWARSPIALQIALMLDS
jgi:hypothetical protein